MKNLKWLVIVGWMTLATCITLAYAQDYDTDYYRNLLLEMGFEEAWLESLTEGGISYRNMVNQSRFGEYVQKIYMGEPIGESGEVIAPRYFGSIRFDNDGIPVVAVLPRAFDHAPSRTAIAEMVELGIMIEEVTFSAGEIRQVSDTLNANFEKLIAAGTTSFGQGAENVITLWIHPYNPGQVKTLEAVLVALGVNLNTVAITPAVTQEMADSRTARFTRVAAMEPSTQVVLRAVAFEDNRVHFTLENMTAYEFLHGVDFDLARYVNGTWEPVDFTIGAPMAWAAIGETISAGQMREYDINFTWLFGILPPGRYMVIRSGSLGHWDERWHNTYDEVYVVVEFDFS